ncbi:MAG: VgrG-related protein [Chloroflexi bacterium]|nr:VgrG-related protein [Chloroflexota bacterium]MCC6894490.1 VgrG-related protein [Anaerolineae bacterium]
MPANTPQTRVKQIEIKVGGTDLTNDIMDVLYEAEIETSLYLPSMFTLRFHDEELNLTDGTTFAAGAAVEIKLPDDSGALSTVFKGEITAIEPEFTKDFVAMLVVRGYDKGHRLNRGTKTKVFVDVTDSDIVSQIANSSGLSPQVTATSTLHKHVFQHAVSDWVFIHERARRNGYEVLIDDTKLYFRPISTTRTETNLVWGDSLWSFQPRMSLAKQVSSVKVRGWNPTTKQAIIGSASSSSSSPTTGVNNWGGALSQSAFSEAEALEVQHPVHTQDEATKMAQSILDEINAGFLEADGTAFGNPALKPGVKVNIQKVGTKFSGKYVVTTVRHIYQSAEPFITQFTVQGVRAQTMADLVDRAHSEQRTKQLWGGIVIGIVTNNNDPDGMGRAKVKFPWLDDSLESNWARVSMPGAGSSQGLIWLPEVNDEVLVAFEHSDFDFPYIVGAVWNGKDKPPEAIGTLVKNGKVEVRMMKTRLGHIIKLTDSDSDKKIEIIGLAGDKIEFDETAKKITIDSKADIDIKAVGNMKLTASGNLDLTATGNVKMQGAQVSVSATGMFEVKGATGKVESSGPMAVKGAIVNIN